jgi:protease I
MADDLNGKRVAILTANEGVEQVEYYDPRKALEEAGADVELIALEQGDVQLFEHLDKADVVQADKAVSSADASD